MDIKTNIELSLEYLNEDTLKKLCAKVSLGSVDKVSTKASQSINLAKYFPLPGKFNGDNRKWRIFHDALLNYLSAMTNDANVPLAYIIRRNDDPTERTANEPVSLTLIRDTPHEGKIFQ